MTTTIDTLVPERLWQAIQPLLPPPHAATVVDPASTTAPPWSASSTAHRHPLAAAAHPAAWLRQPGHLLAAAA
jgi:hypothetical protein